MTPSFARIAVITSLAVLSLAGAPGALAATEQGDAGDLPATSQDLGSGIVTTVWGTFSDASDADVYRLCLTDGGSFSATTVGATTLDTQMFLFDSQGYGIYANDDASGSRGSLLPAHHRFSPSVGGEYFLAISSYNRDPQSTQGEIFQDNFSRMFYPDGVVDANGFGAASPISSWIGRAPGGPGLYRITLTGTTTCVPPDTTAPTVDLRSPVDGAQVAQDAPVVVDFSCADEGGSGLASCLGTTPDAALLDTSELGEVSVTVTARDGAGNQTVVTHTITVVDETEPTITLTTPADGAVYDRDEQVSADYSCADEPDGSGIDSCVGDVAKGAAVDTSTLGQHSFTVDATDHAGNTASQSVTYTVVDVTAPGISVTTPSAGAAYPVGQQVLAAYSCADEPGGSGIATCAGTVPDGSAIDTASVGEKSFTVNATDNAGNPATKTVTYRVVDSTAPSIALTTPADGAVYTLGSEVRADFSCADEAGGSGVAQCDGSVANGAPIDTSTLGAHSFEVRTRDAAGNSASRAVTYTVVYDFDGFRWPVKNPPNTNRWKAGMPVLIRFSLDGYRGERPEADGYPRSTRCDGADSEQVVARGSRKKPAFHYNRRADEYELLWKTDKKWAGSCREFTLRLDDGSVHSADFRFVKRGGRRG